MSQSPIQQQLLTRRHQTALNMPKPDPVLSDFEPFYDRIIAEYGCTPTTKQWSKEITEQYPKMYYQAAFVLWCEKHESAFPIPKTPSPQPHHTAAQTIQAMRDTDFRHEPRRLVDDYLRPTGFPLIVIGQHDMAEFCIIPAPKLIECDKTVWPPFDEFMVGSHILSVTGYSEVIIHLIGSLRKREVHESGLPFRESGYCIALGIDGKTGKAGRVYAIKSQQGDCWLGHIADDVAQLGPSYEFSLDTVFKEERLGVRLSRTLKMDGMLIGAG